MRVLRKALSDIPKGPEITGELHDTSGAKHHDYSHLLPKDLKNQGYSLKVRHLPPTGQPGLTNHKLSAIVSHTSESGYPWEIGEVRANLKHGRDINNVHGLHTSIGDSFLDPDHRGKGLGFAMYEALLGHARNELGATHVGSEQAHSSLASNIHKKLAQKHGFNYNPQTNPEGNSVPGDYDAKMAPYSYAIKNEPNLNKSLEKSEDPVLRMLAIPEERTLALKMGSLEDHHFPIALKYPELRDKILAHPKLGPVGLNTLLSDPSYVQYWSNVLSRQLSSDQLHTLFNTTLGQDCENEIIEKILAHANCGQDTVNCLIDLGFLGALNHKAVTKWTLDLFVHWHLECPDQILIGELARAAFSNPALSEHCYHDAILNGPDITKLAALKAGYYLPEDGAKTLLTRLLDTDVPLRLAVIEHPLCTEELLKVGASDHDSRVNSVARARLGSKYEKPVHNRLP